MNKKETSEMLYDEKSINSQEAYESDVYYDILIDILGVSKEIVDFALWLNGNNKETYDYVLEYATGYKDLDQINDGEF